MDETTTTISGNPKMIYTFRFSSSDHVVYLNEEELHLIPYLSVLVAHQDDFLPITNQNGEYVLNDPIEYHSFVVILQSIKCENAYLLFDQLLETNYIFDTLQLFNYLCINSFHLPLIKDENLMLSDINHSEDTSTTIQYDKANISQARQTAAEFVLALAQHRYNLNHSHTKDRIFSLLRIILYERAIFSSRFRHHTVIVIKECLYSFLSKTQKHLIPTIGQIAQHNEIESLMYFYDDEKALPDTFENPFAWRAKRLPLEDTQKSHSRTISKKIFSFDSDLQERIWFLQEESMSIFRSD